MLKYYSYNKSGKKLSNENITVTNNVAAHRYEIAIEGNVAVLEYTKRDGVITFTHTGTPEELRGRGLAALLTKQALDESRTEGLKIVPLCSYVDAYIQKHKEYADLVA